MRRIVLLSAACLAALGGCALVYDYEDYQPEDEVPPPPLAPCALAGDCEQSGTDPLCLHWECLEGRCVGILAALGTPCGPGATCQNDEYTPPQQCDGDGYCPAPTPKACAMGCSGHQCSEGCAVAADCDPTYACDPNSSTCVECLSCGRWLDGSPAPLDAACPGSTVLLEEVKSCACYDGDCFDDCGSSRLCMGVEEPSPDCHRCLQTECESTWRACHDDDGHGG